MTATEPFKEDGSPPHCEARTMKLEMEDKMVQIKKKKIANFLVLQTVLVLTNFVLTLEASLG